jgi:glycosyl transferase, family 25
MSFELSAMLRTRHNDSQRPPAGAYSVLSKLRTLRMLNKGNMQDKSNLDWSVFDAIYLINLRERTDRRRELEAELRSVGLLPGDPRLNWQNAARPETSGGFPGIGAYGCFLSHLACLQAATASKHNRILILEDDACFPRSAVSRLRDALTRLKRAEWQIWYGGHLFTGNAPPSSSGWGVLIDRTVEIQRTHCIGFQGTATIDAIRKFLELILTRPEGHSEAGPMHTDGAYNVWRSLNAGAVTRATIPEICVQRSSRSDIAPIRRFDSWAVTRLITRPLRKLRNYMRR